MDKSLTAWKIPRSKMTSIVVPDNPIVGKNEYRKKITWDQINDAKHKVNYYTRFKRNKK